MDELVKLILSARKGSEYSFALLCDKYEMLIISLSKKYSNMCADEQVELEDFLQESKIAFDKAISTYDINSKTTFGAYAKVCIRNGLVSFLRKCKSKKSRKEEFNEEGFCDETALDNIAKQELKQQLLQHAEGLLSPLEKRIFMMICEEMSIKEISKSINKSIRSVNNAIYRARRKLKKEFKEKIT